MSLSKRANQARGRYARWQRRIDRAMVAFVALIVALVVLGLGRLLGAW